MLDLLLVTPSSRRAVYQSLGSDIAAIEPPVWSGLIASFIMNRGYSVEILDAEARGLSAEETAAEINAKSPRLTVFSIYGQQPSASTQCMQAGREVAVLVEKELPTMVLGTHASAIPYETLLGEPYSFVCQGEGPHTVLGMLRTLKSGDWSYAGVPGLWYMDGGIPEKTKPAPKIKDLDEELPRQAWGLLDMSLYRAHNWHAFGRDRKPYASIQTSLGCPYKCSFCCINAPFGGAGIRYWSPQNFIRQVDELVKIHGTSDINIKIPDEMFVLNESHVMGICDLIIERGYKLNIWAYARVDTVKESFLKKLKQAGFNWLCLGIESGSKHVREGVTKGRFGDTDISTVVHNIRDAGINIIGNYIFGLPDDTADSMMETFNMAQRLNTEWANFYSAMAYPGSQLYKDAIEKKLRLPEDWIGYSQHSYETLPLPTDTLTGPQVLRFRDWAHIRYFTDPDYQGLVAKKFGPGALQSVKDMLVHKVQRKYVVEA